MIGLLKLIAKEEPLRKMGSFLRHFYRMLTASEEPPKDEKSCEVVLFFSRLPCHHYRRGR